MLIDSVKDKWIKYYVAQGYRAIPSAPLIHPLFPQSFNMSAGMVQLDTIIRSPKHHSRILVCLIQRCFRHFDLARINDFSHLSYFEMLGALTIGQYQYSDSLKDVWNFLTKETGLPQQRLWATYFVSNEDKYHQLSLTQDIVNQLDQLVGNHKIVGNEQTNLWIQKGDINIKDNKRLCGPQIEFFYQLDKSDTLGPIQEPDKYLEISNLIFISHFVQNSNLAPLINPAIESVVGLERILSCLENSSTNLLDTSSYHYQSNLLPPTIPLSDHKIILDHAKALFFILSEQIINPGRNGRQRIVRTLMRRFFAACLHNDLDPLTTYNQQIIAIKSTHHLADNPKNEAEILQALSRHYLIFRKHYDHLKAANHPLLTLR